LFLHSFGFKFIFFPVNHTSPQASVLGSLRRRSEAEAVAGAERQGKKSDLGLMGYIDLKLRKHILKTSRRGRLILARVPKNSLVIFIAAVAKAKI
jgi:hypothetical protein